MAALAVFLSSSGRTLRAMSVAYRLRLRVRFDERAAHGVADAFANLVFDAFAQPFGRPIAHDFQQTLRIEIRALRCSARLIEPLGGRPANGVGKSIAKLLSDSFAKAIDDAVPDTLRQNVDVGAPRRVTHLLKQGRAQPFSETFADRVHQALANSGRGVLAHMLRELLRMGSISEAPALHQRTAKRFGNSVAHRFAQPIADPFDDALACLVGDSLLVEVAILPGGPPLAAKGVDDVVAKVAPDAVAQVVADLLAHGIRQTIGVDAVLRRGVAPVVTMLPKRAADGVTHVIADGFPQALANALRRPIADAFGEPVGQVGRAISAELLRQGCTGRLTESLADGVGESLAKVVGDALPNVIRDAIEIGSAVTAMGLRPRAAKRVGEPTPDPVCNFRPYAFGKALADTFCDSVDIDAGPAAGLPEGVS
jgi:hypothetical protein